MPEVKLGGHFKGGFAQGLNNARTQGRADRAQTLQQEQFDQKKAKQIYDEGVKNLQVMGERLSIMRAQNPDSEAVKQLEAAMQANGAQIEKLGMNLGLPGASGLGQSLMAMPNSLEQADLQGQIDVRTQKPLLDLKDTYKEPSDYERFETDPETWAAFQASKQTSSATNNQRDWAAWNAMEPGQAKDMFGRMIARADAQELGDKEKSKVEGKEAGKNAAFKPKAQLKMRNFADKTDRLGLQLADAEAKASKATTGYAGYLLKDLPDSLPGDMKQIITTINAQMGFMALQAMRDESPSGGALGQVSERELEFLQKTIASLDMSQSVEQFVKNIGIIRDSMQKSKNAIYLDYKNMYGEEYVYEDYEAPAIAGAATGTPAMDPEIQSLLDQYGGKND